MLALKIQRKSSTTPASKKFKNCVGAELSYVISKIKELKLGNFLTFSLGLYGQDKCNI